MVATICSMPSNWLFWVLFHVFVFAMLALDLGVFNRKAHVVRFREAIAWTGVWVALAAGFAVLIYFFGHTLTGHANRPNRVLSLEFITGYVIEEALSIDNLFVFLLLFRYFRVPVEYEHKVLFWGILGALVTRALFIISGVALVNRFHWILYIFGGFVVYAGLKLFWQKEEHQIDPERNPLVRFFRTYVRMVPNFGNGHFLIRRNNDGYATMLMLVLLIVETTDVIFATDSIPAILAISRDPFIVYTSNVFAILGLRSLFFALSGMMKMFHFLHYGLATILVFIGTKMLVSYWWQIPTGMALAVVVGVLVISVAASLAFPKKADAEATE